MKDWSLKKLQVFRYLSYWSYVICTIGIPLALIAWQFDIFRKPGPVQLTGWGCIAVIIVAFICGKHILATLRDMEKGLARTILQNAVMLVPFLAVWIMLTFMEQYIIRIRFILLWTIIGLSAASLLDLWHTLILQEINQRKK